MLRCGDNRCRMRLIPLKSGDDVRDQVVFYHRDLIPQQQFALFQARDLQLIARTSCGQRVDGRVKVTVFKAQGGKPLAHFLFGHVPQNSQIPSTRAINRGAHAAYGLTRNACAPTRFGLQDTVNVGA